MTLRKQKNQRKTKKTDENEKVSSLQKKPKLQTLSMKIGKTGKTVELRDQKKKTLKNTNSQYSNFWIQNYVLSREVRKKSFFLKFLFVIIVFTQNTE